MWKYKIKWQWVMLQNVGCSTILLASFRVLKQWHGVDQLANSKRASFKRATGLAIGCNEVDQLWVRPYLHDHIILWTWLQEEGKDGALQVLDPRGYLSLWRWLRICSRRRWALKENSCCETISNDPLQVIYATRILQVRRTLPVLAHHKWFFRFQKTKDSLSEFTKREHKNYEWEDRAGGGPRCEHFQHSNAQ